MLILDVADESDLDDNLLDYALPDSPWFQETLNLDTSLIKQKNPSKETSRKHACKKQIKVPLDFHRLKTKNQCFQLLNSLQVDQA